MSSYNYNNVNIEYISHDCFRISFKDTVVYIDPYKVRRTINDGDLVICTHEHFDHCSPEDVKKVLKHDGYIVASINCKDKVSGLSNNVFLLRPGESIEVKGIKVSAVPAYNVNKPYHPKEYNGIGVVVEIGGVHIYHAGDTDLIPEMRELKNIDVALLPVSGKYVMNADEACEAAKIINPKVAIPMHYGVIVGSRKDAEKFKECIKDLVSVVILG
ncbi:MAG: MBL fold metallo-hydrolase [Thermoproteales archaeon]|nr:MBL fold metallo-hydrolase [Thermoproteales archaeon]